MDIITGAALALPFFLYLLLQTLRKQPGHGWLGRLLGIGAVLAPTAALTFADFTGIPSPQPDPLLLALAALGIGLGGVLFLLERRQPGYKLAQSRGLLSAGIGVLLLVALLTIPLVTNLLLGQAALPGDPFTQTAMASSFEGDSTSVNLEDKTALEGPLPSPTASPTPQPTQMSFPTATFTPYPTGTPMPTLPGLLLPTSTPGIMPELTTPGESTPLVPDSSGEADCLVTTGANLNLRQAPGTGETLLATIPNSTNLDATATTPDRQWWQVSYNGQIGWVIRDYLIFGPDCTRMR
ncbi:MAG: SH3 domain-containing protein [Anaerolineae bacterium]|nr:SH3 domain-containing protein [Anaerolineae bacterium]